MLKNLNDKEIIVKDLDINENDIYFKTIGSDSEIESERIGHLHTRKNVIFSHDSNVTAKQYRKFYIKTW